MAYRYSVQPTFDARDPVTVYVSYFYAFRDVALTNPQKVAHTIQAVASFKRSYDTQTLEPDMAKTPLCMNQYAFMFSTRIPALTADTTQISGGDYCIIMRNGRFFKLRVDLSASDIQRAILWIYKNATEPCTSVGILTTENRDTWFHARELLIKDASNLESLNVIQDALFVVCLDADTPVTTEEKSRSYWHGSGLNRFFDKSLQFIIHDNGKMGFCGEHSMMDATPTNRLCEFICEHLSNLSADPKFKNSSDDLSIRHSNIPSELSFKISKLSKANSKVALQNFKALVKQLFNFHETKVEQHDVKVVEYFGYGKNLIKSFKISPDAYAQMTIQLAYYKM